MVQNLLCKVTTAHCLCMKNSSWVSSEVYPSLLCKSTAPEPYPSKTHFQVAAFSFSFRFASNLRMAESSSALHVPARSISLPTRLFHLKAQRVEEELKKLQALESLSSASSSIQLGLKWLVELYDFVNGQIVCSPHARQALHLHQHVKLMEDALDESIMLLDACDFARDLIGTLKEQIQDLQSALRRARGDLSAVEANVRSYVSFRKKSKKHIARRLKSLARMQTGLNDKTPVVKSSVVDQHLSMVFNILRQSNASAISVFRSLLLFLSPWAEKTKGNNGWSLLREIIPTITTKKIHQNTMFLEIGCLDTSLCLSLYGRINQRRGSEVTDVQMMLKRLAMPNTSLGAIQDELGCVSRRLIQHRVSILNILTP